MDTTGMSITELDAELAETLPAREVMWCCYGGRSTKQSNTAIVGSGNGNTSQHGFVNVSALNGNLNGNGNLIGQGNFA